jgi:regulator of protease activity HflC (stomatin/prohibitin superfamily)
MAKITVMAYERVVRFVDGELRDVLGPGRHRYERWGRETVLHRVDMRPRLVTVPGQEVLTSDGIGVRFSVVLRLAVTDPVAHLTESQDPQAEVYAEVQHALRLAVAEQPLDALVETRAALAPTMLPAVQATAARVGLAVHDLSVRDLMLPGDLRRAYSEMILARQRGRAELERARAEAATLRSLANTARLLDEHPALLRLRTLQLAEAPGTKVVLKHP